MPNVSQRTSRYHCSSNPPPHLNGVFKQLRKATYGRGYFTSRNEIRSAAAKGSKEYENRGRSDDLVRFLYNTGVIFDAPEAYFDDVRADVIQACCDQAREPEPAEPEEVRLRGIKLRYDFDDGSDPASDVPASGSGTGPSDGSSSDEPVGVVNAPLTPVPFCTHVLYLTQPEDDVWAALCIEAEERPDGVHVKLLWEPCAARCDWVSRSLSCNETVYVCTVQRFVESKVIEMVGSADGGCAVFRFTRHPHAYHVVRIEERPAFPVTSQEFEIIRAVQATFQAPRDGYLIPSLEAWISKRYGSSLNVTAMRSRIMGYRPGDRFKSWGVLFRKGSRPGRPRIGEVETFMSIPGFEAYDFQVKGAAQTGQAVAEQAPFSITLPSPALNNEVPEVKPAAPIAVMVIDDSAARQRDAAEVPSPFPPEAETDPSAVFDQQPPPEPVPESPPPHVVPIDAPRRPPTPEPSADLQAMADEELEAKLDEWRRMHEMAERELVRRREEKIKRLTDGIANHRYMINVVAKEIGDLEESLHAKMSSLEQLKSILAGLETELTAIEAKS